LVAGHRFPDAKPVDPHLVTIIMRTESHLQADGDVPVQPSKWKPASNINPADAPGIPDFLRRTPVAADPPIIRGGRHEQTIRARDRERSASTGLPRSIV
jgi:hypothetical protein